jgi:hypothetical protein
VIRFDLSDDDALLAFLSECIDDADPVSAEAVATAKALGQLSDIDAELASLVADSLLDEEVVMFRSDATLERLDDCGRLVTFATPELTVDIDLQAATATVIGAITPALSVDVELETAKETLTTRSDDLGRFHLKAPSGRCRLRIHAPDGIVVTPWITR